MSFGGTDTPHAADTSKAGLQHGEWITLLKTFASSFGDGRC